VLDILDGTNLSTAAEIADLKEFHMTSTDWWVSLLKRSAKQWRCCFMPSVSHFFHRKIFRRGNRVLTG